MTRVQRSAATEAALAELRRTLAARTTRPSQRRTADIASALTRLLGTDPRPAGQVLAELTTGPDLSSLSDVDLLTHLQTMLARRRHGTPPIPDQHPAPAGEDRNPGSGQGSEVDRVDD